MSSDKFAIHEGAKTAIDALAMSALLAIQELDLRKAKPDSFASDRVVSATITDDDIVGEPTIWIPLNSNEMAFAFMSVDNKPFGLTESSYKIVEEITGKILKIRWARNAISEEFIGDSFVNWAREYYGQEIIESLTEYFIRRCEEHIKKQTIWAPVQYLEIEKEFEFGISKIIPLTKALFDHLESEALTHAPEYSDAVKNVYAKMRKEMQGIAAVVVNIESEPNYATEAGRNICQDAVGLLRFFSAASISSSLYSPVALLNSFSIPKYKILLSTDESKFGSSEGIIPGGVGHWRLRSREIDALQSKNLGHVGSLLDSNGLSNFGKTVRSALLSFSRALTFPDLSDRVLFALSSVEGLLLKDGGEPIQQNVGDRMAFLIEKHADKRREIVENLRKVYKIRSQYIHHRVGATEADELDTVFRNIRSVISYAVASMPKFSSHSEFIEAIEKIKYGG